jgi:hypothetical protein
MGQQHLVAVRPWRSAYAARAAAPRADDSLTGDLQYLADRLDPEGVAMLVDEISQDFSRRSSSAWVRISAMVTADFGNVTGLSGRC